jgi:putative tryptophan/tyrosine transport system substrate-binding protein
VWEGPTGHVLRDAGGQLGISLNGMLLPEGTPLEIERVFTAMARQRPDGVLVTGEGDQYAHRQLIVELAEKSRVPALYATGDYVERGGLMRYVDWSMTFTRSSVAPNWGAGLIEPRRAKCFRARD